VRYFGSKASVVDDVLRLISARRPTGELCDPFGGVATVGAAAKREGYVVTSGDQLAFAHAFQVARVVAQRRPAFSGLRKLSLQGSTAVEHHLASLPGCDGWLVQHYARERGFFTITNARRIEAVRQEVITWLAQRLITTREAKILRASLIRSADSVANTAGTYYAYLKSWHRKALRPFVFSLISPTPGARGCRAQVLDANELATARSWDVLYLDPPFNDRRYGGYYHLPESLALGHEFEVRGQAGIPVRDVPASPFYSPTKATAALRTLVHEADYELLALHYAANGVIPLDVIRRELRRIGRVTEHVLRSRGYTTQPRAREVIHHLFLVDA
jgi:adenine-specific DNA-methyltransferase